MEFDSAQIFNQLFSGCLTASFTILGGVIVLSLGQLALRFFIEPIHEQSKLIARIATDLTYYANVFGNLDILEKELVTETSDTFRKHASDLRGYAWTIKFYGFWHLFGLVPKRENAIKASEQLIGLSNSMSSTQFDLIHKRQEDIKELLGFK